MSISKSMPCKHTCKHISSYQSVHFLKGYSSNPTNFKNKPKYKVNNIAVCFFNITHCFIAKHMFSLPSRREHERTRKDELLTQIVFVFVYFTNSQKYCCVRVCGPGLENKQYSREDCYSSSISTRDFQFHIVVMNENMKLRSILDNEFPLTVNTTHSPPPSPLPPTVSYTVAAWPQPYFLFEADVSITEIKA